MKFQTIDTRNGCRCPKRHLLAVNFNILFHTHDLDLLCSRCLSCRTCLRSRCHRLCFRLCAFQCRNIDCLIPVCIDRGIGGVSRLCFDHAIAKRCSCDGKGLGLHFLAVLICLSFDARTGCRTVIKDMTDVLLVTIKLKEQGKGAKFHIGVLNQYTVTVQFFFQALQTERLRNHCKFQVTVITHVVIDYIIGNTISVEILRFAISIQGDGNSTRHCSRCAKTHCAVLCDCQQCIVGVLQIIFNFVVLICHFSDLHFKLVKDLIQLFAVDPGFGLVIKDSMCIKHIFHFLFHR
nr:MAG TPA: hypothetical protein [Caudoviricetes sp.]